MPLLPISPSPPPPTHPYPHSYTSHTHIHTQYDGARILLDERRDEVNRELQSLEERTGYRVRILTHATRSDIPDETSIRKWAEVGVRMWTDVEDAGSWVFSARGQLGEKALAAVAFTDHAQLSKHMIGYHMQGHLSCPLPAGCVMSCECGMLM
jgi:hypothetical protein